MESISSRVSSFVHDTFPDSTGNATVDADRNLLDAGLIDSIGVLTVVTWIEETFDVVVDDEDVVPENLGGVASIVRCIEYKLADAAQAGSAQSA